MTVGPNLVDPVGGDEFELVEGVSLLDLDIFNVECPLGVEVVLFDGLVCNSESIIQYLQDSKLVRRYTWAGSQG